MTPLLSSLVGDAEIAEHFAPRAEIAAMLEVEAALAEAQAGVGMIAAEAARRIAEAFRDFQPDEEALRRGLTRDGVVVPELVRQLREAVGETHGKAVHLGATSQDVIDTGLMLRLKAVLAILDRRLRVVLATLDDLSVGEGGKPLMAHTRMQEALPFTVAAKIETWAAPLRSHAERIARLNAKGLAVQLGGPIGDGSSFCGSVQALTLALAKRLGLTAAPPWHSSRERIAEIGHVMALLSGSLGKIGQDVALMAQNEVAAVRLTGSGGSSAMAHKQNPVAAEVLVALARFNAGLAGTLHQAMVHENERSGAAWTLEWMVLPQMAEVTGASLSLAGQLLAGASFSRD